MSLLGNMEHFEPSNLLLFIEFYIMIFSRVRINNYFIYLRVCIWTILQRKRFILFLNNINTFCVMY